MDLEWCVRPLRSLNRIFCSKIFAGSSAAISREYDYLVCLINHFHCDLLGISTIVCFVFVIYVYCICILHLTFWEFMASGQDYSLESCQSGRWNRRGVLYRGPPHNLQAQRGFLTSSPNRFQTYSDTAAEDQLIRTQWLTAWTWQIET